MTYILGLDFLKFFDCYSYDRWILQLPNDSLSAFFSTNFVVM